MKKQNLKIDRIDLYGKLTKKGMSLSTLLEFSDRQLLTLSTRLLGEEDTKSDILKKQLEVQKKYEQDMAQINQEKANVMDTNEDVTDPRFPEPKKYKDSEGKEMEVLEDDELEEMIMSGGAPEPETSFYNPDAEGFQSQGPMDSYGGDGDDEGFAGTFNENLGFTEPKYSFKNPNEKGHQSDGPMGHSAGIHEDDLEEDDELTKSYKDVHGMDTDQDAPQIGPDNDSNADDGMGIFERPLTKKELIEVAVSQKQYNFYQLVHACKTSKYKDCGDGRNDNAVLNAAKSMSLTSIEDYTKTENVDNLPKEKTESMDGIVVENWLLNLVEKYERPQMSKKDLIQTIKEMKTMDVEVEAMTDPDVEDAALELPSWLDFDSLFTGDTPLTMPEPTTKPTTTPLKTPKKPGRKSPYQPKHKPKPKAYRE
tara:strand:- start:10361 stop:11629 length:1269 start_codon:yes stop_codon:yes gene_type:complete